MLLRVLALVICASCLAASAPAQDAPAERVVKTRGPALVRDALPDYPDALRAAGIGGEVLLELDLDETGRPFRVTVVEGVHEELDASAVAAAKRLRFRPALVDGEPQPSTVRYRFAFTADSPGRAKGPRRLRIVPPGEEEDVPTVTEAVQVVEERPWRVFEQEREKPVEGSVVGEYSFGRRDVELAPGALGDVNMVLHTLPGVSRASFFVGSYSIRGGDPQETVTYLDGVRLRAPDIQGLLSRFNPTLLDTVTVHAGSQPARLTESVAGVTEISYADPANDRFHALVDLNLLTVSAQAAGPLGKSGAPASFVISVRRALTDLYLSALSEAGIYDGLEFGYGDVFTRLHLEPGGDGRSKVDVSFLFSDDTITLAPADAIATVDSTLNVLGSVRHRWNPTGRFGWDQLVALTYATETNYRDDVPFLVSDRLELNGRSDWRVGLWRATELRFGVDYLARWMNDQGTAYDPRRRPTWIEAAWADEGALRTELATKRTQHELGLYGEVGWTDLWGVPLEGRFGARVTPVNPTDEVTFSPRGSLALRLPTGTTIKAHASLTHQFPDGVGLFDPEIGAGTVEAARAITVSAAVEQHFDVGLNLRAEFFNRDLTRLLVWPDTDQALAEGGTYASVGTGVSRGVDISAGIRRPGWGLWGSYSYLYTRRTNPLNTAGPQEYEPWFSTPHMVKLGGDLHFGRRRDWILSGSLTLADGRPFSPVVHRFDRDERAWLGEAYDYNQQRWGWQNAVSVRLERRFVVKGRVKVSVYVDLANIQLDQNMTVMRSRELEYGVAERPATPELFDAARFPALPWIGIRGEL